MHDKAGMYFISFAVVDWIDVFIREQYFQIVADSLNYCIENKSMLVFAYCIMTSHIHLVFRDEDENPSRLLKEFKTHTSKQIKKCIAENKQESRREWILERLKSAGEKNSNVKSHQFWQQHNHYIELWSNDVIDQKINYIHNNPVIAGFVTEPRFWKYSSAGDYADLKSPVNVTLVG